MSLEPSEYHTILGEHFTGSQRLQRYLGRAANLQAAGLASLATFNYYAAPDERFLYTGIPLMGSAALYGILKYCQNMVRNDQDNTLEQVVGDFDQPDHYDK